MAFTPHTPAEIQAMLSDIGVASIADLFDEIPKNLFINELSEPGPALSEQAMARLMQTRADQDQVDLSFLGAGAYEHHIPAAVWEITTRGEFYTAYTPYQAEASQGTLQLLYEYQTMMARLTGLDVSNASMYDGASALAEAILMAVRLSKSQSRQVLIPKTLSPLYLQVLRTILAQLKIKIIEIPYVPGTGQTDLAALEKYPDACALVIVQPNFFGVLEPVDQLTDWAKAHNMLSIALVNPTSLGLLKEPGAWGNEGVDIACGEGQPLGIPLASGGPYFGFLCCKQAYVRQMPGRIIGRTVDLDGKPGYALTLQAREQHIRRSKATSNICTNQGLMVTAATIYLSLLGPEGLRRQAAACHQQTRYLLQQLTQLPGVTAKFTANYFHEIVIQLPKSAKSVLSKCSKKDILAGLDLGKYYPEHKNCLLLCATETKTREDIDRFVQQIASTL